MSAPGHAVIVGASAAGLRAAEAARRAGFWGRLTVVGAEAHPPYDRTLLSKGLLTGETAAEALRLPWAAGLDAEWRLGTAAAGLDRAARQLRLSDGGALAYDRLVIATGARARPWLNPRERALRGLHTLRDRDDALRLREALAAKPDHVVVVGGGLLGCEVAQAARSLGLRVTMVVRGLAPLARLLGVPLGEVVAARLEADGTALRLATQVRRLEDDERGSVIRLMLADGETLDTSLVVACLGVTRNTEWLEGSGLRADEGGLDCNASAHALDARGQPDATVLVAGDVARLPHQLFDGRRVAVSHWSHAEAHGTFVGAKLAGSTLHDPFAALPAFRSVQGTLEIAAVGLTEGADGFVVAEGSPRSGRFLVVYGRAGVCVAAVALDGAHWLASYADMIARRAPFPPRHAVGDPGDPTVLPPGFP